MLANAHIPIFAVMVGLLIAVLTLIPGLLVEALAVKYGRFRDTKRTRAAGRVGTRIPYSWAVNYAFIANFISTIPGLVTAFFIVASQSLLLWFFHYVITVLIEIPTYHFLGIRLSSKFVLAVIFANSLTYIFMYGIVLLVRN